jgi:hypothetical protein
MEKQKTGLVVAVRTVSGATVRPFVIQAVVTAGAPITRGRIDEAAAPREHCPETTKRPPEGERIVNDVPSHQER